MAIGDSTPCGIAARHGPAQVRRRSTAQATRKWRLTTQVPDIVAASLDDAQLDHITIFELALDPAALWEEQWERARVPDQHCV
jgi:hypothetical protein